MTKAAAKDQHFKHPTHHIDIKPYIARPNKKKVRTNGSKTLTSAAYAAAVGEQVRLVPKSTYTTS